jgi:hypothetical protein
MKNEIEVTSAVDVVRCLFLARELERLGHVEAGRRWRELAVTWLARCSGHGAAPPRTPQTWPAVSVGPGQTATDAYEGAIVSPAGLEMCAPPSIP